MYKITFLTIAVLAAFSFPTASSRININVAFRIGLDTHDHHDYEGDYSNYDFDCSESAFDQCFEDIPDMESMLEDKEEGCRKLEESLDCVKSHAEECSGEDEEDEIQQEIEDAEKLYEELCEESENTDLKCLEEYATSPAFREDCKEAIQTEVTNFIQRGITAIEDMKCDVLKVTFKCAEEKVEEKCGEDATVLLKIEAEKEINKACEKDEKKGKEKRKEKKEEKGEEKKEEAIEEKKEEAQEEKKEEKENNEQKKRDVKPLKFFKFF